MDATCLEDVRASNHTKSRIRINEGGSRGGLIARVPLRPGCMAWGVMACVCVGGLSVFFRKAVFS